MTLCPGCWLRAFSPWKLAVLCGMVLLIAALAPLATYYLVKHENRTCYAQLSEWREIARGAWNLRPHKP